MTTIVPDLAGRPHVFWWAAISSDIMSKNEMLLTITASFSPATDLGYLLHKNPSRAQSTDLEFGKAHVLYPEISSERCTAALLLEIDPIRLVRGRSGPAGADRKLEEYVNDRPYAASSFLSVAIARVFRSAMAGHARSVQISLHANSR
jgi:hypothetical protein